MFDYLQQFNNLPKDLRDRVSSPLAMKTISELEGKYQVDLAMIVMKIMIKSLAVKSLSAYLTSEFSLAPDRALSLANELKDKIFSSSAEYLGMVAEVRALDLDKDIDILIKEAGLTLSSANLISRFKNILATYLKGIRSKIDARASLAKDIKIGGLNLSSPEIDRVFKVCDKQKFKSLEVSRTVISPEAKPVVASARLNEIIGASDQKTSGGEYNLKQALVSGQVKPVTGRVNLDTRQNLDTTHELAQPDKQLDLPQPTAEIPAPAKTTSIIEAAKLAASPLKPITTTPQPVPTSASAPAPVKPVVPRSAPQPAPRPTGQMAAPIVRPSNVAPSVAASPASRSTIFSVSPSPAANRPAPALTANRPQMHDIKAVPRVMGPTEELRFLDVANFRRLGATAPEATAKIFTKIKLLEKDGYDKMVLGVQAWRQGVLNRLYVRLGQEAIVKGVTLKEAIAARQKAGQESLSLEEIEAIVSLNSKLVF